MLFRRPIRLNVLLISILALGLLLLQIGMLGLSVRFRYYEQFRMAASDRGRLAITVYQVLRPLDADQRLKTLETLKFESFGLSISPNVPFTENGSTYSRILRRRLVELYGLSYPDPLPPAMLDADNSSAERIYAVIHDFRIDWSLTPPVHSSIYYEYPRLCLFNAEAALPFPDGGWLHVTYHSMPGLAGNLFDLLLELSIQFILQILLAVAVIRYLTRPLGQLADFADRITPDVPEDTPEGLPENGPSEIVRTSQAFRAMYARIRRYVEERMHLVASISHDLRTPLTRLRLQLENEKSLERPDLVFDALDDLQNLAEDAISLARTGTNNEPERPTSLSALLESMVADYEEQTGQNECLEEGTQCLVNLELEYSPYCLLRTQAFRRCLENLVDNALRYGGKASIYMDEAPDKPGVARIRIEDDGPGIPQAELENVFQPFYRIEHSRNSSTGGTGLGLGIARDLARLNHAELSLENRPEGGLRALLLLPALQEYEAAPQPK